MGFRGGPSVTSRCQTYPNTKTRGIPHLYSRRLALAGAMVAVSADTMQTLSYQDEEHEPCARLRGVDCSRARVCMFAPVSRQEPRLEHALPRSCAEIRRPPPGTAWRRTSFKHRTWAIVWTILGTTFVVTSGRQDTRQKARKGCVFENFKKKVL